jgi:hypothetical protein
MIIIFFLIILKELSARQVQSLLFNQIVNKINNKNGKKEQHLFRPAGFNLKSECLPEARKNPEQLKRRVILPIII